MTAAPRRLFCSFTFFSFFFFPEYFIDLNPKYCTFVQLSSDFFDFFNFSYQDYI